MGRARLIREFRFYKQHQQDFARRYNGKVLVIKGHEVIGVYDNELQALRETSKTHEPGTFLIQRCDPDPHSTEVILGSRAFLPQPS